MRSTALGCAEGATHLVGRDESPLASPRLFRASQNLRPVAQGCRFCDRWPPVHSHLVDFTAFDLTSVGAGALGVVMLVRLYPRLTPQRLVATDIAHAIPLALGAGAGHLAISGIDLALLRDLLAGSIPAALVGAAISSRLPHAILRTALGAVLLVIGLTMLGGAM